MCNIEKVANAANFIVNGYAFTKQGECVSVLNLNLPDRAANITESGEVLETSMDDIEMDIV